MSKVSTTVTNNIEEDDKNENVSKNVSSPRKRARMSIVDKATEEGKALLKELGFDDSETPGRRRTRAATKGVIYTPPPPKRERKSAGTPSSGGRRGRKPKKDKTTEIVLSQEEEKPTENTVEDGEEKMEEKEKVVEVERKQKIAEPGEKRKEEKIKENETEKEESVITAKKNDTKKKDVILSSSSISPAENSDQKDKSIPQTSPENKNEPMVALPEKKADQTVRSEKQSETPTRFEKQSGTTIEPPEKKDGPIMAYPEKKCGPPVASEKCELPVESPEMHNVSPEKIISSSVVAPEKNVMSFADSEKCSPLLTLASRSLSQAYSEGAAAPITPPKLATVVPPPLPPKPFFKADTPSSEILATVSTSQPVISGSSLLPSFIPGASPLSVSPTKPNLLSPASSPSPVKVTATPISVNSFVPYPQVIKTPSPANSNSVGSQNNSNAAGAAVAIGVGGASHTSPNSQQLTPPAPTSTMSAE